MMYLAAINWDPDPTFFHIPIIDWPVRFYGIFFVIGFSLGYLIAQSILEKYLKKAGYEDTVKISALLADRLCWYVLCGTILGARALDVVMYQSHYSFWEIFMIWKGGLASHGGGMGVVCGVILFQRQIKKDYPELSTLLLVDLLSIPNPNHLNG